MRYVTFLAFRLIRNVARKNCIQRTLGPWPKSVAVFPSGGREKRTKEGVDLDEVKAARPLFYLCLSPFSLAPFSVLSFGHFQSALFFLPSHFVPQSHSLGPPACLPASHPSAFVSLLPLSPDSFLRFLMKRFRRRNRVSRGMSKKARPQRPSPKRRKKMSERCPTGRRAVPLKSRSHVRKC